MKKSPLLLSGAALLALTGAGCQLPSFLSREKQQITPVVMPSKPSESTKLTTIPEIGYFQLEATDESNGLLLRLMKLPWDVSGTFTWQAEGEPSEGLVTTEESTATSTVLSFYSSTDKTLGFLQVFWPEQDEAIAKALWTPNDTSLKEKSFDLRLTAMPHTWQVKQARVAHNDQNTGNELCHYQSAYPQLVDSEPNARAINLAIERSITGFIDAQAIIPPIEQRGSEYIAACVSEIQNLINELGPEEATSLAYSHESSAWVTLDRPSLISLRFNGYEYTGGAHGNPTLSGLTMDTESGKILHLKDLFKGDKLQSLIVIERQKLLSDDEGSYLYEETNGLYRDFLTLPLYPEEKQLELFGNDSNFYLTEEGIVLYHTAYEIAAYAAGQFETLIPYSDLRDLIRIDGPLASFIQ